MSTPDGEQQANERFIDALLEHLHDQDQVRKQRRIDAALAETVGRARLTGDHPTFWERLRPVVAIATAALVVLSVLFWQGEGEDQALAAVQRSIDAMTALTDRQYELELGFDSDVLGPIHGELSVRGASQIVIRLSLPTGDLWLGEGQDSTWVIPAVRGLPVLLESKGRLMERVIPGDLETPLPLLQISSILERLRESYDVKLGSPEGELTILEARREREDESGKLPDQVRIEAEASGVVRTLSMQWGRATPRPVRRVRLSLAGSRPLPDTFYEHQAHHDGRHVIDTR